MMNRRYVLDSFEFQGETVHFYRIEFERVEPSQENPYAEGGRCVPDPRDVPNVHLKPARRHSTPRCLTRRQFVRAFQAEADARGLGLPVSILDRVAGVAEVVSLVREAFEGHGQKLPRRIRRWLAAYDPRDLAFAYDTGWMGRLMYLFRSHRDRRGRSDRAVIAKLGVEHGSIPTASVGAMLARNPI